MNIFFVENINSIGIYFSKKKFMFNTPEDLRCIDFNYQKDIYCFSIIYFEDEYILMNWISTNPLVYNQGFASKMINEINQIGKIRNKKYIILDDCSGVPPPRNLYYKLSFQVKVNDIWVDWHKDIQGLDEERRKCIL